MDNNFYKKIGKKIRSVRERKKLSQELMSNRMGYKSVATVSLLESGSRKLTVADLTKIAQILEVPITYLIGDEGPQPEIRTTIQFRARNIVPSVHWQIEQFVGFAIQNVQLPSLFPHNYEADRPGQVGKIAQHYIKSLKITQPPVSPHLVAHNLNMPVYEWSFPDRLSGLTVSTENGVCIGVNQNHANVRQKFTIAHEIGHVIMHRKNREDESLFVNFEFNDTEHDILLRYQETDDKDPIFEQEQKEERQANWFAADLLMPKKWVERDFITNGINSIPQIAQMYGVSEQALWVRLKSLRLVD